MQIYELAQKKLNEDSLTDNQIDKIFDYVEKASTNFKTEPENQGPIASAASIMPKTLINKGISALMRGRKINADKLRTTWAGMQNEPTTENLSRMLAASGVNPKIIRDALRQTVPVGPAKPRPTATNVAPSAPPAPQPAASAPQTPAAPKYSSPTQVVDALMKTMPKDWLPEITAELLKRQRVGAVKK